MSRAFGFLALMLTGVLAVAMLAGSVAGTMHEVSTTIGGGQSSLSPLAIGYGTLGIMMGFAVANLMRFSWVDLPRMVASWLRGQRRTFAMTGLAGVLAAVLLFY